MTTEFIINHLWQSSCFVLLAAVLGFVLRKNSPKVRYGVWLSASLKFLVPLSLLVSLGHLIPGPTQHAVLLPAPIFPNTLIQIAEPFSPTYYATVPADPQLDWVALAMGILWALGFFAVTLVRYRSWVCIRATLRASTPVDLPIPVPAFIAPGAEEPGVVGFLRPVLVLPTHLLERLDPQQLNAVLAHELCHVRRRDNFFAAVHMVVEAIFWFHPLVWWIGSRMVEERELACDEEVLRMGCEPTDYVEGILKVCRFYTESPLPCVSGVTGADVKKRLRAILAGNIARELNVGKKVVLAVIGMATLAAPFVIGVLNPPAARAQSRQTPTVGFEVASVRANKSGDDREPAEILPGGKFIATNNTLRALILNAYGISGSPYLLEGGPSWVDSARYDIDAKAEAKAIPANAPPKVLWEKTRLMLQTLLADRFKLSVRRQTKEMPVYQLVVAKNGPKLKKSDCSVSQEACHGFSGNPTRLSGTGVDMYDLALLLDGYSDRPVSDNTGVQGLFDIKLQWNPTHRDGTPPSDVPRPPSAEAREGRTPDLASLPSLFDALEQQIGLKLESHKGPVEIYVIDHVEQPSAN